MYLKFEANTKGTDYCVGDIHGNYDRLIAFLHKIGFDMGKDRLFSVGDLVDRGPSSLETVSLLERPWFYVVRGNHEQLVIDVNSNSYYADDILFSNGGRWYFSETKEKQDEIAFSFNCLPYMIEVETPIGVTYGIVHADVPFNDWNKAKERLYQDDTQVKSYLLWSRDRYNGTITGDVVGVDYVVVGHTPLPEFQKQDNVLRLDTGACFLGKYPEHDKGLCILNLFTREVVYEQN